MSDFGVNAQEKSAGEVLRQRSSMRRAAFVVSFYYNQRTCTHRDPGLWRVWPNKRTNRTSYELRLDPSPQSAAQCPPDWPTTNPRPYCHA